MVDLVATVVFFKYCLKLKFEIYTRGWDQDLTALCNLVCQPDHSHLHAWTPPDAKCPQASALASFVAALGQGD